jgi:hypothetical protein
MFSQGRQAYTVEGRTVKVEVVRLQAAAAAAAVGRRRRRALMRRCCVTSGRCSNGIY